MSELRLELPDGPAVVPGGTFRVQAGWWLASPPERLELRLFWHTAGKGTQDVEIVETRELAPSASGQTTVELRAPVGPYSFSGRLISLLWALELVALPAGETARAELVLSPTGEEVRIDGSGAV